MSGTPPSATSLTATEQALASGKLYGLQYLRGFGILLVLWHHSLSYTTPYHDIYSPESIYIMAVRHLHMFFVISGLIMMYIHYDDPKGFTSLRVYLLKRHIRIFPMVFGVVIAGALGLLITNRLGMGTEPMSWGQFFNSLLIYPMTEPPQPIVLWTLRHELIFYLVFSVFFIHRWVFFGGMAAWMVSSLLLSERGLTGSWSETGALEMLQHNIFYETFFWDFNYLFLMGIGTYYLINWIKGHVHLNEKQLTWGFIIAYGLFAFATFSDHIFSTYDLSTHFVVGGATVLLMFFSVGVKFHKSLHDILLYMGDASYSIYLAHMVAMSFVAPILGLFTPTPWLHFFALMTIGTVSGLVAYEFFEKPALRYLRRFAK